MAVDRAALEAKAAVLSGAGKNFSAGLDLAEHIDRSAAQGIDVSRNWQETFDRIQRGAIPYFCALHGAVVGGGMILAAAAHVRVADENTSIVLPEGQRGMFLSGGGSVNISRLIGVNRLTDMMLTGRVLSAEEAENYGAVNYVVPNGKALDKAVQLARIAAQNAPLSNYTTINALPRIHDVGQDDGLFIESMISSLIQDTPEAHAGMRAFLDKKAARLNIPKTPTTTQTQDT